MANDITLGELIHQGLQRADQDRTNLSDDGYVSYSEARYIANNALSELWDIMTMAFEDYVMTEMSPFSLVSGTESYSLPSDFYKISKVFLLDSNFRIPMRRFGKEEAIYTSPTFGSEQVSVWYIPQYTKLVNEADAVHVSIPVGWEDYVVACIASKAAMKEEAANTQGLIAEREMAKRRIIDACKARDAGRPMTYRPPLNYARYAYRVMGNKIYIQPSRFYTDDFFSDNYWGYY